MLPIGFGGFTTALAKASPSGIAIVEQAIDKAITDIETQIGNLDPETFEADAFIPASAFGAADRSPEVALHHTRAHGVIKATLVGVRDDLTHFKEACVEAREVFTTADTEAAAELQIRLRAVEALANGTTGYADEAYDQAVHDNAHVQPTDEAPAADGGAES